MTATVVGEGITPSPEQDPVSPQPEVPSLPSQLPTDLDSFRALIHEEMAAYVADAERRLAQAREIERSIFSGADRSIHAEDLNVGFAMIDGYNLTANSPGNGSIAWSNLHVVLLGVDYKIADGNSALKYVWFVKPASYTSGVSADVVLSASNTLPTLGAQDALIFINNAGTPISVLESSVVYAVGPGAISNAQLDSTMQTLLTNLQTNDVLQQAQLDGAITSYYQNDPPWPSGSPSPVGGDKNMGDVWYDSNDGGAFRWTGASGTPANTWQRIADTDTASIAALVNTKVTTYLVNNAPGPTAPSGGFSTGDMWMVLDQGNKLRRWSGSAWVDVLIGDGAIASGISGAKIGSGINGDNVTAGTVAATRIGTGVNGANLSTATGLVGPSKLNTAFHVLY